MTGATVLYTFDDGSALVKGGSFDLHQVHKVRQQLGKPVVSTKVAWRRPRRSVSAACPGCGGFSVRIHRQYCEAPYSRIVAKVE